MDYHQRDTITIIRKDLVAHQFQSHGAAIQALFTVEASLMSLLQRQKRQSRLRLLAVCCRLSLVVCCAVCGKKMELVHSVRAAHGVGDLLCQSRSCTFGPVDCRIIYNITYIIIINIIMMIYDGSAYHYTIDCSSYTCIYPVSDCTMTCQVCIHR
jgi:hypothetical protein